jgi:signal transduction histidine kinase
MADRAFSTRTLVLSFAAVTAGFVAATAMAEYSDFRIRTSAESIVENSAASVFRLSSTRSILRRFEVAADDYVDSSGGQVRRADLERLREELGREWRSYQLVPTYPNEKDFWPNVEAGWIAIDVAMAEINAALDGADPGRAENILERRLKPDVESVDGQLAAISELNQTQGVILAQNIDDLGRRSIALAFWLDGLCVALAVAFTVLLVRAERRHRAEIRARTEELELFSSRVAHDILSPLTTVAMSLELVGRKGQLDDRVKEIVHRGQDNLLRVRRLVDDLWEFARAGAQPPASVRADVAEVVLDVVDDLTRTAQESDIELAVEPLPHVDVKSSDGVLTSLIANLVRNAIKHMGTARERKVVVRAIDRGASARVEVDDTGPGIPVVQREAIFEPYVRARQSRQPGLGLGLATVKRFVERHGGVVGVESAPGGGSRFWFELPKATPRVDV